MHDINVGLWQQDIGGVAKDGVPAYNEHIYAQKGHRVQLMLREGRYYQNLRIITKSSASIGMALRALFQPTCPW
jgi:hypothetical protein